MGGRQKVVKKCKLGWQVKVSRNLVNYRLKLLSGPFGYMLLGSWLRMAERGLLNYVHITSLQLEGGGGYPGVVFCFQCQLAY